MAPRILGVSGSLRDRSHTLKLVNHVLEAAARLGAETRLLDLRQFPLPMYEAHVPYLDDSLVQQVLEHVTWADGIVIGSPEYHGCMSGAAKNFLDFLYRENAGKLFALVAATGGSQGAGCFDNMRAAIQYCHGWTLPYNTAATGKSFDADGALIDDRARDRLDRMARDLVVYAPLLRGQFQNDLLQPPGEPHGFAHWMA